MVPWTSAPVHDLNSLLGHRPHPVQLSYGTAGFRSFAGNLHEAMVRCGVLAACRSHVLEGRAVGAMVTASHNPACDNGLKLVEPDGSMLDASWEKVAGSFVNAADDPAASLRGVVDVEQVARMQRAVVVIGWDTRDSCEVLVDLLRQGVEAVGGTVEMLGRVTTPQLHFHLRARNMGKPSGLVDYFEGLRTAFKRLAGGKKCTLGKIVVDCACGVGSTAVDAVRDVWGVSAVVNRVADGVLNEQCGADFVQKKRRMPHVYGDMPQGVVWASLDGDADRLVMYMPRGEGIALADGDRFACLLAKFVAEHVKGAGVELRVGVAQTAYSNGAATEFLKGLGEVEIVVTKTGVKWLEKAVKRFDVGIYWEPNGHGTVLFADEAVQKLMDLSERVEVNRREYVKKLLAVQQLANQAVGDGVADLLLVIAVLTSQDMSFEDWLNLYAERRSVNLVVRVADRSVITTEDADRIVKEPVALREAIATATSISGTRAFVRPSGTEDVVRIYAEAPSSEEGLAKSIADQVAQSVYDTCSGIGDRPNTL